MLCQNQKASYWIFSSEMVATPRQWYFIKAHHPKKKKTPSVDWWVLQNANTAWASYRQTNIVVVMWLCGDALLFLSLGDSIIDRWPWILPKIPEGECLVISQWSEAQLHLGYAARQLSEAQEQVDLWMAQKKKKIKVLRVLTWILFICCGRTLTWVVHSWKPSKNKGRGESTAILQRRVGQSSSTLMWKTDLLSEAFGCNC